MRARYAAMRSGIDSRLADKRSPANQVSGSKSVIVGFGVRARSLEQDLDFLLGRLERGLAGLGERNAALELFERLFERQIARSRRSTSASSSRIDCSNSAIWFMAVDKDLDSATDAQSIRAQARITVAAVLTCHDRKSRFRP